jgi:hypothetical protein
MKKIFILLIILTTVFAASAQSAMIGNDNNSARTANISNVGSPDGIIESITVYPNPVVDVLKVSFKSNRNTRATISLFNNIGKQSYIRESEVDPGNNTISIDIAGNGIERGIYFVQIKIGKEVLTRKLIVK